MTTTLLLADDHPLFRKGLRDLLKEQTDFEIVGEAGNGREAIDLVKALLPDVVVMDIAMPDMSGIDATRKILQVKPSSRVVALSMHAGKRIVEEMLQAGAAGYILKKSVPEDIVNGIRTVSTGEIFLSPAITDIVVSKFKDLLSNSAEKKEKGEISPILRTKLQRPSIGSDMVPRPDLLSRFADSPRRPLTVVSAAAGYGKSTLASMWLDAGDSPYGWLSLDEEENDLRQFLMYLLSVLDSVSPGAFDTTRSLLLAAELPPVAQLARTLANDLVKIKEPFVLVLDDFHKIHDKAIHELLGVLLKHPPESLQLILVTRRDLPLLTSTLRGRGQIHEIGAADLHFSVEETSRFLKNVTGLSIDAQKVATIQQRLEGWPAGIRLIAQSLKDTGDMDRVLAGLHGGFATIVDYLWNEVLSNQSPVMAKLMSAAAVPNQFCASLCDALIKATSQPDMAKMDGDEFIARQQKENLFLIPLDSFNQWFRYHHMFQELLRNQLHKLWQPEEIAALHSQANAWLVDNNITDAALVKSLNAFRVQADATLFSVNSEKASVPHEPRASSLSPPPLVDPLTNRELDVLSLLAQRFSNKEIADQLCISTTTVKGHLQNIYGKLAVNKRREAIDRANKLGII